jgi:signal transduction histidine kinase
VLSSSVAGPASRVRSAVERTAEGRGPSLPGEEQARVGALTHGSLRWLAYVAVFSRVVLTVPAVILTWGVLGERAAGVLGLAVGVVLVDGGLVLVALRRPGVLASRWLFGADLGLTVTATLGATLLLAPGTFLLAGRDALTGYGWGTVGLWTAIRGWRCGTVLVGGTVVLQVAMAVLNGAAFDDAGSANLLQRVGLAAITVLVTAGIVGFAGRSARLTAAAGLRAGRLAERADVLRGLHDTALAELEAMALTARRASVPAAERLAAITARAAELWSSSSSGCPTEPERELMPALAELVDGFRARGIEVHLVGAVPDGRLRDRPCAVDALAASVREALNNVAKHAHVRTARLRVSESPSAVEVEVADRGRGFAVGRADAGFGLRESIRERMHDVGGSADVDSVPGRGTRVRLVVPTREAGDAALREATDLAATLRWFPLAPLSTRLLSLAYISSALVHVVPGRVEVLLGLLAVCHVVLITRLWAGGTVREFGSPVLLGADLAVAAALYLWVARLEPVGAILTPNGDGIWLYVLCTVAFWLAARGPVVGAAVFLCALALQGAGLVLNGIPVAAVDGTLAGLHVTQLAVSTGFTWLVLRTMHRGLALARAESLRAGRQVERMHTLARLHRRVLATWRALAEPPGELDEERRLDWIRGTASATAGEIRAALWQDGPGSAGRDFAGRLDAAAKSLGPLGLDVELVVTELTAEPPPEVTQALVAATRLSLTDVVARGGGGAVVIRASGSGSRAEISLRDRVPRSDCCAEAEAAVLAVGGRIRVRQLGARGARTELLWSAP